MPSFISAFIELSFCGRFSVMMLTFSSTSYSTTASDTVVSSHGAGLARPDSITGMKFVRNAATGLREARGWPYSLSRRVTGGGPERMRLGRRGLIGQGAATALLAGAPAGPAAADDVLYVNSWGGAWNTAIQAAYFADFTAATGARVQMVEPVSYAKLKAQVQSGVYEWDVSDFASIGYYQALHEGLLEPIDRSAIDQAAYPPGNVSDHGVSGHALGTCLAYRRDKFPDGGPRSWADFWDVRKFPGERALYNQSVPNLAFALLADGVPRESLFPLDVDRAFRKLDAIKPHIKVWWTQATQSRQLLEDGEVDMIAIWNAQAQMLADQGAPVEIVWNQAQKQTGWWFVAKGSPRAKLAWRFLDIVARPKPQAEFGRRMFYGPSNPAAYTFLSPEVTRKLPTNPAYAALTFEPDAQWLTPRMAELNERFAQWLAG